MQRFVQRLLEGEQSAHDLLGHDPFAGEGPPLAVRIGLYAFSPTEAAHRRRTGEAWVKRYVAPHLPPARRNDAIWDHWLPRPELFHVDDRLWRQRALRVDGVDAGEVAAFWGFVAAVPRGLFEGWDGLAAFVERTRTELGEARMAAHERVLGCLTAQLLERLEPFYFGARGPRIELPSYFHLGMLAHHIVGEGEAAYRAALADLTVAARSAASMSETSGLLLMAVFQLDSIAFQARKLRLARALVPMDHLPGLPGFLAVAPFLAGQFVGEAGEERLPALARRIADGEWMLGDE
jgi:hypothetical protein